MLAAAIILFTRDDGAPRARERLVAAPAQVRPSVLVDVNGAVLEEFSGDCGAAQRPYLCERVRAELLANDAGLLKGTGLTIRTSIDPRTQEAAQRGIDAHVGRDDEHVAAQAMIVPGTGEIRALATSRGTAPALQHGSTAMVYPLAAALESGLRYADGFPHSRDYRAPKYTSFKNCKGQNIGDPTHTVVNDTNAQGAFTTLETGTRAADNAFFLKLTERVGLCQSVEMARRLGLSRADGMPLVEFETFALGINEVDPIVLAGTYATLAAHGKRCAPRVVTEVRGDGGFARTFPARCEQALEAPVADAVTGVLTGALARSPLKGLGRDAAGMTGNVDGDTAASYAGYTPDLASAVTLGHPDDTRKHRLTDVSLGGKRYPTVSGTTVPGPIWKDSMRAALDGTAETPFIAPDTARFGGCRDACAN